MPALTRPAALSMPLTNAGTSFTVTCASGRSRSAPVLSMRKIPGAGPADSIPAAIRANALTAPRPPSTRRAPILKPRGACFCQNGPRTIFKHDAVSTTGQPRSIDALIGTSGCHLTGALVADRSWKRRFDDPIPLPRGRQLITLEDAGKYITRLPKAEHEAAEWQAAMEALILVATSGGPTMFGRIGIMRALNRHVERVFNPDRKDHHWGRRKLARDR